MKRVLFCCLGNICRSPTAEGVLRAMISERGLEGSVEVDSCGTAGWHRGKPPDERAVAEAAQRGYDLSELRARQVTSADFMRFDYILAMDRSNLEELLALCPAGFNGHLGLLLALAPDSDIDEVPDPYYGEADGFTRVLDLLEQACAGLLDQLSAAGRQGAAS